MSHRSLSLPLDAPRSLTRRLQPRRKLNARLGSARFGSARLGTPGKCCPADRTLASPVLCLALSDTADTRRAEGNIMATLAPESARPPHSQLGSSPSIQTNLPPNRGLERALEEAAASGALNLSSRKLKEFPRTAANHDLTDTVDADLSKNRLADVPSEVCHLVALETLNLYHNCIRTIPDSIIGLQSLTSLNLSRNQLGSLPACLCSLPLRVLNASNNKLVSLPETIGQLHGLMELDISCNEITALPRHIGRLKALRELNVRRNLLCVLPEDLADLPLVKFDFSCNKVSTIPVCYRKMKQLQSLQLENNPLQSPPAQICIKGKVHIFKYLSIEACRSEKMPDSLYLPVMERLSLSRPTTGRSKQDSDSGVGSDNGDKRLSATEPSDEDSLSLNVPMSHITEEQGLSKDDSSEHISSLTGTHTLDSHMWTVKVSLLCTCIRVTLTCSGVVVVFPVVFLRSHKSLESVDPQFTMRRKMEQLREELELMEQLRDNIESRLKINLPEDLGTSLMDGVVLCHLANHIRPRSVASIHVPSPAVPKLSMAKCRRNVENFLDACRKIGVPEDRLCLPHHILEEKGLVKVCITVQALVDEASSKQTPLT
uniref:Calponin-homology (CH) domain-containing protein n=1 Tax=Anabas testudineus TaxID=64144 RepID=A0A7N6BSC5_ANATE